MKKQDIQNALLSAYMERDNAQSSLDSANAQISALRNMLAGLQVGEQKDTPDTPEKAGDDVQS
jgi:hypothetical protein